MVPEPKNIRMAATAAVVMFPSRTEENAFLYPLLTACFTVILFLNSSLIRSLMIIFASTAIPAERISPAIPGSVIVYWGIEIASTCNDI